MGILDASLLVLVVASAAIIAGSSSGDGEMVYEKLGIGVLAKDLIFLVFW